MVIVRNDYLCFVGNKIGDPYPRQSTAVRIRTGRSDIYFMTIFDLPPLVRTPLKQSPFFKERKIVVIK